LTVPYGLVFRGAHSAIGTLTIGSAYFWGVAVLFCGTLDGAWKRREHPSALAAATPARARGAALLCDRANAVTD